MGKEEEGRLPVRSHLGAQGPLQPSTSGPHWPSPRARLSRLPARLLVPQMSLTVLCILHSLAILILANRETSLPPRLCSITSSSVKPSLTDHTLPPNRLGHLPPSAL